MKSKFLKKAVAVALSAITAVSTLAVCMTSASAATDGGNVGADLSSIALTSNPGKYMTRVFRCDESAIDAYAFCIDPTQWCPIQSAADESATVTYTGSSVQQPTDRKEKNRLKNILYYGFGGPGWDESTKNKIKELCKNNPEWNSRLDGNGNEIDKFTDVDKNCFPKSEQDQEFLYYALTHFATSIAAGTTRANPHTNAIEPTSILYNHRYNTDDFVNVCKGLYDYIQDVKAKSLAGGIYDRLDIYYLYPDGLKLANNPMYYQRIAVPVFKRIVLDLQKTSLNPSLSDGNSCYSLAGAEYGVYNDISKAEKDAKGETRSERWANSLPGYIRTDEKGYGQYSFGNPYFKVPIGTYYALEAAAPKGYRLSDDVVEFKDTGETTSDGYAIYRAVCSDTPESDPIGVMLQKKSTTGLQAESGDLAGAEFEVSYYDVDPNVVTSLEELQKTGKSPLRTWVFKTDKKGQLQYSDKCKVSGPELYYHSSGRPSIPTGALTFKEVKAPTSGKYLVNDETFFTPITSDGKDSTEVDLDIIVPEVPATAGLTIQKSSEDGIVEDLWFRVKSDNGYTNDFATNALGTISVEGLDVYDGNGKKISYTITELGFKNSDGKYTLPKRYKATEPKTVTLDETQNVVVRFENKVVNGGINIVKTSDDGKVENIYFEIKGSNGIVRNVVTDKNGQVSISALPVYDNDNNVVSYTVKELGIKNGDGTYSIPKKYIVPKPQTVTLDSGTQDLGLVKTINVQNKIVKGSLEINKTSTDSKIEGVWFNITSANGFDENYATDKNGNITITDLDVYDDTDKKIEYTIKELGIKDASGKIIFPAYYYNVNNAKVTLEENTTTTAPTFENKNKLGQIRITKRGEDGVLNGFTFRVSSITDGYTYNEIFTQKSISGIRVRNLQPFLADGTPIQYKVEEVGFRYPNKTYADGEYDPLPARYIKAEPEYVEWNPDNADKDFSSPSYQPTIEYQNLNLIKKGSVEVIKVSDDGKIADIWFEVKGSNGIVRKVVTDTNGKASVNDLYVYGDDNNAVVYTITELGFKNSDGTYALPDRYNAPPAQTVTINYDETTQTGFANATFKNTLKKGSVSINKTDTSGKGLANVEFCLYSKDGNAISLIEDAPGRYTYGDGGTVKTLVTTDDGNSCNINIDKLPYGDYYFLETSSPNGFLPYAEKIPFNIKENNQKVSLTCANQKSMFDTGGSGVIPIYLIGIASLLLAGTIIVKSKYKKSRNEVKKMQKHIFSKSLSLVLVIMMLFVSIIPFTVSAATQLDSNKKVSITLQCSKPGYTFEVFEVAKLTSTTLGTYETSYKPLISEISDEVKSGDTKATLLKLDNLSTLPSGVISYGSFDSKDKTKTFSELEQGIYYVKCVKYPAGVKSVENSVVALPYFGDNGWIYSVDPINLATKVADDVPTTHKEITNSTKNSKNYTDVSIGDTVEFKITNATAGSSSMKLNTYTVYDEMSKGLTLNNKSVKVYLADKNGEKLSDVSSNDYKLNITEQGDGKVTKFNLSLNAAYLAKNDFYETNVNSVIVTYSATVNKHAVKGEKGNTNDDIELKYGNTSGTDTVPGNTVYVYTYGVKVLKLNEENKALAGAKFELYLNEADAKGNKNALASGTSDDQGNVKFINNKGEEISLKSGNYFIAEVEAPENYNLYGDIIPISIDVEYNDIFSNDTWVKNAPENGYATCTVTDTKLIVPQTGGYVWILYVVGAVSLIAGLSLLVISKKAKAQKKK